MKRLRLFLLAIPFALAGCGPALEPFARVDAEGYQAGVQGKWKAVAEEAGKAITPSKKSTKQPSP